MSTIDVLLSSKNNAIVIKISPHPKLINFDFFKDTDPPSQSLTTEDASELIDELIVDIAADNTPAIKIPLTPIGK